MNVGRLGSLEIVLTQLMGGCMSLVQNVQAKGRKDAVSTPKSGVAARCPKRKTGAGGDVYGVRHERGTRTHRHQNHEEGDEHEQDEHRNTEGRRDVEDEQEEKATVSGRRDGDSATDTIGEIGVLEAEDDDPRVDIRWSCGELIGAGAFGRVYMGYIWRKHFI